MRLRAIVRSGVALIGLVLTASMSAATAPGPPAESAGIVNVDYGPISPVTELQGTHPAIEHVARWIPNRF